ncbi:hypothetical protein EDF56_101448 [Novosphingobium sp. PhB165]|uniref:hypothetical protein n=1 Tax=Novosphingobium sp. PhB165 TaxID=2485105 RepID=UPI00104D4716|nr:hypothetical protein [Novosphingobium sp. PhB165]TCM21773.1 hypothetical protein EDF56_101448 [Novosphingobium sp. PhB165]
MISPDRNKWSSALAVLGFAAAIGLRIGAVLLLHDLLILMLPAVFVGGAVYLILQNYRPSLLEPLRMAVVLLAALDTWQLIDAAITGALGSRIVLELALGCALACLIVWRANRVNLRLMVGFQAFAIVGDLYAIASAGVLDRSLGFPALYALVHMTILLAVLRVVRNLEREHADALFDDELFS